MDSGSEKSVVSRLIGWLRDKSDTSTSASDAGSNQGSHSGGASSSGAASAPPAGVASGTPAAPTETTPSHLPSEEASVPPNAASLDLDSTANTGSAAPPAASGGQETASTFTGAPASRNTSASASSPAASSADTDEPSQTESEPESNATLSGSTLPDLGDPLENARRANYGRGNLEVGALASAGSPASETTEPEEDDTSAIADAEDGGAGQAVTPADSEPATSETDHDPAPEQPVGLSAADLVAGASSNLTSAQDTLSSDPATSSYTEEEAMGVGPLPGVDASASDPDGDGLAGVDGTEDGASTSTTADPGATGTPEADTPASTADNLGTTDTTDTELSLLSETDSETVDPAAAFAAGLAASDTSADLKSASDMGTDEAPSAGTSSTDEAEKETETFDRADAFDSVDSTGIFGLADRDADSLAYLDDASRESFEATVDELPESTGLFGLRDDSPTDLSYLSGSETERYSFEALATNDVANGEDYDSSAMGTAESAIGTSESDSQESVLTDGPSGGTVAASEMAPDSATGLDDTASTDVREEPTGDELPVVAETVSSVPTATADPESLLAPEADTDVATANAASAELPFDDAASAAPDDDADEGSADSVASTSTDDQGTLVDARSATGTQTTRATGSGTSDRVKGVDGVCPPDYPIKGNASSKVYHVPGLLSYEKTKAEWCFPSEEAAVSFGYRAPGGHRNKSASTTGGTSTSPAGLQHTPQAEATPAASAADPSPEGSTANGQPATTVTTAQHSSVGDEPGRTTAPHGSVAGDGTRVCPAEYPIKGNGGSMIYHVPGTAAYDATIPEWCFATEDDAINAGFRAPRRR